MTNKQSNFKYRALLFFVSWFNAHAGENQVHSYRDANVFPMAAQLYATGSGGQLQNPLPVFQGGTGVTALTDNGVVVAHGTSDVTVTGAGTTGTVLVGNTGADPSFSATPSVTMITIANAPSIGIDGTNKDYVDMFVASVKVQQSCTYATAVVLSNSPVYANGASGVGATLTATVNGVLTVDGNTTWTVGDRVLIKDQASTFQNGIYTVTDAGSVGSTYQLTRATDFDTPTDIQPGDLVPVESGATNASTIWIQTATVTTVGTDPILFSKFLQQGIVTLQGDTGSAKGTTVEIAGGNNVSTAASSATVTISVADTTNHAVQVGNASGSLTSLTVGTNGQVLLGSAGANPSFVTPTAGSGLTVTATSSVFEYGLSVPMSVPNGGTGSAGLTQYAILIGNGTNPIHTVGPNATSGIPLVSQGAADYPILGTAKVPGGGTGATSFNAYGVIIAGSSTTGALQSTTSPSTAGQGLVSAGVSAVPVWQNVFPGYAVAANNFIYGGSTSSTLNSPVRTVIISPQASSSILSTSADNVFFGDLVAKSVTSAGRHVAIGSSSAKALTTGSFNVAIGYLSMASNLIRNQIIAIGYRALTDFTGENFCFAIGTQALESNVSATAMYAVGYQAAKNCVATNNIALGYQALLTSAASATHNNAVGYQALYSNSSSSFNVALGDSAGYLATGGQNIYLGSSAGSSATTGSNNIIIGYNAQLASATNSNAVVIGASASKTFIYGINGITTAVADAIAVYVDSTGQLGTIVSSKKFKKNIISVDKQTAEKLAEFNIVTFHYIDDKTNTVQYGVIAEEIEKIFPELVVRDQEGNILTIQHHQLVPLLIKYAQLYNERLQKLSKEIVATEAVLATLVTKIAKNEGVL